MKNFTSIRTTLTVRLLMGLFICYAVLGTIFYNLIEVSLTDQFDNELVSWVNNISEMFDFEEPDMDAEFHGTAFDNEDFSDNRKYYQVRTQEDKIISKSPSLKNFNLPALKVELDEYRFEDIKLPDNINGRAVAYSFINRRIDENNIDAGTFLKLQQLMESIAAKEKTGRSSEKDIKEYYDFLQKHRVKESKKQLTIVLAQSRTWLDKILIIFKFCLLGIGGILIICSWIIVRISVRQGLLPLNHIAEKIEKISFDDLEQRFSKKNIPEEMLPVIFKLNEMLQRLDEAFSREKRFTANAAHELRTPISELRALAEVGLEEKFNNNNDIRGYFKDAYDIAVQMQALTESLLTLARIDSNKTPIKIDKFNINFLLKDILNKTDKGNRTIDYSDISPEKAMVDSDKTLLSTIVSNLIKNAVHYSPDNSQISISLKKENNGYSLSFLNGTTDLTEKDIPYLFEPFWRKDLSRSDLSHAGVGLTLVNSCCKLLNINLKVTIKKKGLIEFTLHIPEK